MAVGTMSGALLSARRPVPGVVLMAVSAGAFGLSVAVAAVMPGPILFGVVLLFVGLAALTFMTASNPVMQRTPESMMRGRVLALRIEAGMGGTPIGAPLGGWEGDWFGVGYGERVVGNSGVHQCRPRGVAEQ